eukprot:1768625-Lingulodinium_polyedra.AAC.1
MRAPFWRRMHGVRALARVNCAALRRGGVRLNIPLRSSQLKLRSGIGCFNGDAQSMQARPLFSAGVQ